MMLGSFSIFVSSAGLFGLLGESVQELFYLHIFLVTAPIVFVMILLVLAHSFYYRKVAANSAPAALDPDFIKQHQFETSSQQNHENATPDFSSGDSFSAHLQQQKMDDKTTHQEFTAQMPRSQMTVLDHNAVPNFSPYYESRVDFGSDYAERSPHISGRFALITISVILVLIALALAFLPHTYGSWAIMAGIISACLGVAVLIAGIRGLRATWLTFLLGLQLSPLCLQFSSHCCSRMK
ncbi:hypothetical protein [Arcanobacterium hippocoleae]|uniref:hypothetical protein n=1 Tax=Arcanobacterium hippocoleae TaxID=149017 RepID=UPI00334171E5